MRPRRAEGADILDSVSFRARGSWVFGVLVVCACKSEASVKPDPKAAPSTSAPTEDPNAKKKVTEADCTQWSSHGVDVFIADVSAAAKECPPEERAKLVPPLESQRAEMKKSAFEVCKKHLGEEYVAKDGLCFSLGETVAAFSACHFAPMTNPGDDDLAAFVVGTKASCAKGKAPSLGGP